MKPYGKIMQFIKKVFVVYKCLKFLSLQRHVCVFVCVAVCECTLVLTSLQIQSETESKAKD